MNFWENYDKWRKEQEEKAIKKLQVNEDDNLKKIEVCEDGRVFYSFNDICYSTGRNFVTSWIESEYFVE